MSGGKEKRTYGLDLATGRVRYECTIDGCKTGNDGRYGQKRSQISTDSLRANAGRDCDAPEKLSRGVQRP